MIYYYEYFEGNNGPASRLRRIGNHDDLQEEKDRRDGGFFELVRVDEDLGETIQKRDLDGHIVDNQKQIPKRGVL